MTMPEDQITLYSPQYGAQSEQFSLNQITAELLQTSKLRECQKLFRIFDHKYLNVNEINAGKFRSFTLVLMSLDDKPTARWIIRLRYLLLAVLCFILASMVMTLIHRAYAFFSNPYLYSVVALLVTAGAILLVYTYKSARHVLQFKSKHGQVAVVELLYNNPDKARFRQLAGEISRNIKQCQTQNYYTDAQVLAAELSEHRRLRNEGILSDKVYQQAKQHILDLHSPSDTRRAKNTLHH